MDLACSPRGTRGTPMSTPRSIPSDPVSTPRIQTPRSQACPIALSRVKMVIVGAAGSGKSALALRVIGSVPAGGLRTRSSASVGATLVGSAMAGPLPTVGVDFAMRSASLEDQRVPIRLHVLDTSGQSRFRQLLDGYLQDLDSHDAVIVVYDASNRASFEEVGEHFARIRRLARGVPQVALVASMNDLAAAADDAVTTDEGSARAKELAAAIFAEVACPADGRDADAASASGISTGSVESRIVRPLLQECYNAAASRECPPAGQHPISTPRAFGPTTMPTAHYSQESCGSQAGRFGKCTAPLLKCFGFA